MRIDLHLHSTASDGTQAPSEVIATAAAAGLDVVALTDHDTTSGWAEATEAARRTGVVLVPGLELSCQWRGISVHLLSYLHDPDDAGLAAEAARTRGDRVGRARRMVELIAADYPLDWQDVVGATPDGATVGRPHIADALVARGHMASRDEAFDRVLRTGSPYYVRHYAPDVVTAVRRVVAAGGVAVMAHPRAARRGRVVPDEVIAAMADAGLAGLEVDHRDHLPEERVALRVVARELGLFVTGSSDYHGAGKQNKLGENLTAPAVLEQIEDAARATEVVRP
ncbi:MAG: PHP domain-containing protein [Kineosporiaceae bacterium]|nr:PHP domain-containing protein [Kineosporiaceae bacterium]MBL8931983.1 PHP domain-containing protein [Kineosporiaceae bacterium]